MTSVFARLCIAAALAFAGLGLSAPVMAQTTSQTAPAPGAAWTDAEIAELQSILRDVMVPMLNDLNAAVNLAPTDRPAACTMAKSSAGRLAEVDRRLSALYARIKAEGRDLSGFNPLMDKLASLKQKMPSLVEGICNGTVGAPQADATDPAARAAQEKVLGFMRRYSGDMTAATNANARGDGATACASLKDGLLTLDELEAYLRDLMKTYGASPADAEQMQRVFAQIQQWRTETRDAAKGCPAS